MTNYMQLRELGYRLCGPVVAPFVLDTSTKLVKDNRPALFLMREGYHMHALFDETVAKLGKHRRREGLHKLNVSRAFLCKLFLNKKHLLMYALRHHFKGDFKSLLAGRFALTASDFEKIGSIPTFEVVLPEDAEKLIDAVYSITRPIHAEIVEKESLYREYLLQIVAKHEKVACVDIGFSGSIQRALNLLFGIRSHGYYMFLSAGFKDDPEGVTAEGFWSSTAKHGAGDILVDASMVLESIFTAPHGQLVDIRRSLTDMCEFVYGSGTRGQREFHYTYPIVSGIHQFIEEMLSKKLDRTALERVLDIRECYKLLLKFDGSPAMEALRKFSEIDDDISGLGTLNPFIFLRELKK